MKARESSRCAWVRWLPCVASIAVAGCAQIDTGTGTGSGNETSDGGAPAASDAAADAGTGGTNCGADPQTGVTLCLQTNACPNLAVDTGAFPSCGFRQGGSSPFDLECLCDGVELCPIGAPTSCASAEQLLMQQQSALQVCQQVSTGGCLSVQADGGAGSGGTGTSSACAACVSSCGGTPSCYQACGC